jgi:SAM-dependent methyltransferase
MSESLQEALEALREALDQRPEDGGLPVAAPSAVPLEDAQPVLRIQREGPSDDLRWAELARHIDKSLAGRRVLVLGPRAEYDAVAFAAREAECVLAREHSDALHEAWPSASRNGSGVEFVRVERDALDPDLHGTFDIVHCSGLMHRVLEPMSLLGTMHRMTAPNGTLLIDSMMLAAPDQSEFMRFVPDRHAGDPTWWFVPGRLAFRWMVEAAGFRVEAEFGEMEGPRDGFPVVTGYLRAVAAI